ncbi:MAG: GtrA family protein [Deltaproteobacteria bacterium]|nr:GtrA family protein [Deltaproteobacteria bacterium]
MKNPRQMLAAGLGGAVGSVFDFAALVLLVEHSSASIPVSAFLAAGAGAVVCFLMNKYIAFRDRSPVRLEQLVRFGMVAVATAFLTAFGMKLVAVDLGVPYPLAKAICAAAVFVTWTYPAQSRLVFRRAVPVG